MLINNESLADVDGGGEEEKNEGEKVHVGGGDVVGG